MRKINLSCLKDLWEDFSSTVITFKVDLVNLKICQVCDIVIENDDTSCVVVETFDIRSMQWERKTKYRTRTSIAKRLDNKYYYIYNKHRFLPMEDMSSRYMSDYFGIKSNMMLNGSSERFKVEVQAEMFRKKGQISFICVKDDGFFAIVGLKSINSKSDISAFKIAKDLAATARAKDEGITFYSDYLDKRSDSFEFSYACRIGNSCSLNGKMLYIVVHDSITARKSIRIDIAADINNRLCVIDCIEINHRHCRKNDIANEVLAMINQYEKTNINDDVSADAIAENCIMFIPKKSQCRFIEMINDENSLSTLDSAYDAIDSDIFNVKNKEHKTHDYDGGRRKFELALGQLLTC